MPKLINLLDTIDFKNMLNKMGTKPNNGFNLNYKSLIELQLATTGIELNNISEIDFDSYDGFAFYKNQQILFYIRQPRNYNNHESLPVFHVYKCSTIINMIQNNRGYRYVATNKKSGYFELEFSDGKLKEHQLAVCHNCLVSLKSKYKYDTSKKLFDIKLFFEQAPHIINTFNPEYDDYNLPPPDQYPRNWQEIRRRLVTQRGKICQDCGLHIIKCGRRLHVHHIDGKKFNNSDQNLKILCEPCHYKYHSHLRLPNQEMIRVDLFNN